jgi:cell wall-associated NlpC family hydrolase
VQIIKYIYLFLAGLFALGCANVKQAVYDKQKRRELTYETKKTYAGSSAGKAATVKNAVISAANKNLGAKYKYGGISPKEGFDCSGLVYYAAISNKIDLPRSSSSLADAAPHINWKSAGPGDLLFFGERGKVNHVAIIEKKRSNELWVIHSTSSRGVISENVLSSSYWNKRILFAIDFSKLIR